MEELEKRLIYDSNAFNFDNMNTQEIMYFIYKQYIVALYRLTPILDGNSRDLTGNFENVYVIYDTEKDEVFNESSQYANELFKSLPAIDNVLFTYDYTKNEVVERAKKIVKEEVYNFYKNKIYTKMYIESLITIYGFVDNSSKELIKFFIDEAK